MIGSPSRSTWSEGREGEKQFSKRGVLGELSKKGDLGQKTKITDNTCTFSEAPRPLPPQHQLPVHLGCVKVN